MRNLTLFIFACSAWIAISSSVLLGNSLPSIQPPHYEDFNQPVDGLPVGWFRIVNNPGYDAAVVQTTTIGSPYSPPFHINILSNNNVEADVMLISPLVESFSNTRIRFYSKCNSSTNIPNLIIGTMTNPQDATTFVAHDTIKAVEQLTNAYKQFIVIMEGASAGAAHIAFRHGATPNFNRSIYIDDFVLEHIPTGPVLKVTPDQFNYGNVIHGTSKSQSFVVTNTGLGLLSIPASEISISGENAGLFSFNPAPVDINLQAFETATITVKFSPFEVGPAQAILNISNKEVPLQGNGFDPTISQVPHTEDFNYLPVPTLPLGWSKIVQTSSTGNVETMSVTGTILPPNAVRLFNSIDVNAQMFLITPVIALNLNELRVRFYSRQLLGDDCSIIVGTITNPANSASFTPLATFPLNTTWQELTYSFADYTGTDAHIAFKAVFTTTVRTIYLDQFILETIPGEPIFHVNPNNKNFSQVQTGTLSVAQNFTISNHGEGLMVLNPENIFLTGEHSGEFILENLEETVELAGGESAVVTVTFAPQTIGNKLAVLSITGNDVPLSGEGINATITTFPWYEDFSNTGSADLPFGWVRDRTHWKVRSTNHAGGEAPELRFMWSPAFVGKAMVTTPLINTSEFTSMKFSFKHMLNNFGSPGIYTIKVVTIVGETHHLIHQWVDPSNIPAEDFWAILTAENHGIGAENLRIGFIFDGTSVNVNDWNIDNLLLEQAPDNRLVTFKVMENSAEELPLEGALIEFDTYISSLITNDLGIANTELPDGNYNVVVSLDGYQDLSTSFTIAAEDLIVEIRMTDFLIAPSGLQVTILDEIMGDVSISWIHPSSQKLFTGFNIYLNDMQTVYQQVGAVNQFIFNNLPGGDHTVGVQGVYTTGLSNIVTKNFTLDIILIPTVEIPWNEDFTGISTGNLPEGWNSNRINWAVINTSLAGGNAPELQFSWEPEFQGTAMLKSPYINSTGYQNLMLSFRHMVDNFTPQGDYILKLVSIVDDQQFVINEWASQGDITPQLFSAIINNQQHGVGSDSLQIAWIFQGNSSDINWWNIDNVSLDVVPELYTVTFNISDQQGEVISDAVITFDGTTFDAGHYEFTNLVPASYPYSISREGFHTFNDNLTITDNDLTIDVVLIKDNTTVIDLSNQELIKVFPNPASTRFNVIANADISEIRIVDMSGKIILRSMPATTQVEINVSDINPGIYVLQIITANETLSRRLNIVK
jgi:hypothetical protein